MVRWRGGGRRRRRKEEKEEDKPLSQPDFLSSQEKEMGESGKEEKEKEKEKENAKESLHLKREVEEEKEKKETGGGGEDGEQGEGREDYGECTWVLAQDLNPNPLLNKLAREFRQRLKDKGGALSYRPMKKPSSSFTSPSSGDKKAFSQETPTLSLFWERFQKEDGTSKPSPSPIVQEAYWGALKD